MFRVFVQRLFESGLFPTPSIRVCAVWLAAASATVRVWDALFPDRRDAVVLGGLPVRA